MPFTSIYLVPRSMVYIDLHWFTETGDSSRFSSQIVRWSTNRANRNGGPLGTITCAWRPWRPWTLKALSLATLTGEVQVTCLRLYMFVPLIESIMNSHELLYISWIFLNCLEWSSIFSGIIHISIVAMHLAIRSLFSQQEFHRHGLQGQRRAPKQLAIQRTQL